MSADGTPLSVHQQGSGPALVLVPGTLAPRWMYQPLLDALGESYRVTTFERRDYGTSGAGPRPSRFAAQAQDVAAVLAQVDEPCVLFGHSFGGLASLHATEIAAGAISDLVLYEPPVAFTSTALRPTLATARECVAAGQPLDSVVAFFHAIADSPEEDAGAVGAMLADRAGELLADLECMTEARLDAHRWAELPMPVLLLHGGESGSTAKTGIAELAAGIPKATIAVFPGLGHHPDDPAPVLAALAEHLPNQPSRVARP